MAGFLIGPYIYLNYPSPRFTLPEPRGASESHSYIVCSCSMNIVRIVMTLKLEVNAIVINVCTQFNLHGKTHCCM